jgi:hypothetical protein
MRVRKGHHSEESERGIIVNVKVEEAERFYEEDEDPRKVFAAFDAAQKGRTAPPHDGQASSPWSKVRREIAAVLRRLARVIEPSQVRPR